MNTKKNKNKKGNKQTNPTCPLKQDPAPIQEKNESENSEKVDIVSDIVTEVEIEVPKKPKRSRGNKKKQERDDDDNIEEKALELDKTVDDKIETCKTDVNKTEAQDVTLFDPVEKITNSIEEAIKATTDELITENVQKVDPFEQEIKHSKKKNRKKKRIDSDRSDKSRDALSCTTAFHELLDVSNEKLTDDAFDTSSVIMETRKVEENINVKIIEDQKIISADSSIQDVVTPETELLLDEPVFIEAPKNEGKKKKNKKDKRLLMSHQATEESSIPNTFECLKSAEEMCNAKTLVEIIQDQRQMTNIKNIANKDKLEVILTETIDSVLSNVQSEIKFQDVEPYDVNPINTEKHISELVLQSDMSREISELKKGSSTSKAKIAKPVDKKRKDKQEPPEVVMTGEICLPTPDSLVCVQQSNDKHVAQKDETTITIPTLKEPLQPTQPFISDIDRIIKPKEKIKESTNPMQEPDPQKKRAEIIEESEIIPIIEATIKEQKYIPTNNTTGKKKRKPLKMPIPAPVIPEPVKSLEEITTELIKEEKEQTGDDESIFETLVPADVEFKANEDKLDEILELKIESHDIDNENVSPIRTQQFEEKSQKPKRRGKKSLKMPLTPGVNEEQFNLNTETKNVEHTDDAEVTAQQSPLEMLEIRSVRADDSECSPCDVAPDIVYPRSTSQLNIDDNNNTIIREISLPDTLNLPVGLSTPLIQGSGETPIGTPIMVSSFNITEMESSTEKTDLKSKVIEVNQDMEELRLSIERSIAELTEIEKSEKDAENKCEESHTKKNNDSVSDLDIPKQEDQVFNRDSINPQFKPEKTPPITQKIVKDTKKFAPLATQEDDKDLEMPQSIDNKLKEDELEKPSEKLQCTETPPVCPARRDNKGKSKKRKGKQEAQSVSQPTQAVTETSKSNKEEKTEEKPETKDQSKEDTKQKDNNDMPSAEEITTSDPIKDVDYDPIDNFEDALATGVDDADVNKTFELLLNEVTGSNQKELASHKSDINITAPEEDFRDGKVPQPKNLLGHPNIPVSSNKDDFKKEKHKKLNTKQAKVKIKDANNIESRKESKQSQTESSNKSNDFSSKKSNENGDFIYKYSFRKVFLQNTCHVCVKELSSVRVPCNFCNLLFYCSVKHKDEDWPQHQALCFAISTIVHVKDQKHIYAEAKNITGQNYRLLRMQIILSCEKVLKRRLVPWEQEALLYPRLCADVRCREWRQSKLKDCDSCGQISYCANSLDHLPLSHQRWCKSYALYQKLVTHQQIKGRLEPKLPTKVMTGNYEIPEKINEVLASMYEEEIDMNDIQYAALTQIATAPLTVAYSHQLYRKSAKPSTNGIHKKSSFVIHVLGAELQFEADVLNKWEVFFLHLRPDVNELVIVLISNNLNPGNLPLELLGKIRLCDSCCQTKRRIIFSFQDKMSYQEYRTSDDFIYPDIVCAFNASINRSSYNTKDQWPGVISSVMRLRPPFLVTSHTPTELHRDLIRIKEFGEVKVVVDPQRNSFASVRPDRNFITDDETPLLFKNQCFSVLRGV